MGKLKNIIKNWRNFMKKLCLIGLLFFTFIGSAYCELKEVYYAGGYWGIDIDYGKNSLTTYATTIEGELNSSLEILFYGSDSLELYIFLEEENTILEYYINNVKTGYGIYDVRRSEISYTKCTVNNGDNLHLKISNCGSRGEVLDEIGSADFYIQRAEPSTKLTDQNEAIGYYCYIRSITPQEDGSILFKMNKSDGFGVKTDIAKNIRIQDITKDQGELGLSKSNINKNKIYSLLYLAYLEQNKIYLGLNHSNL
ncbi:MAG: hypothetical protein GY754_10260, partial [bacterium]|nr:hypothetical protein [bacterium]